MQEFDAIIVGAGPAGLTAGIYLARAMQRVLIVDQSIVGGQVILTHAVANYPGRPETSGYQLVATMRKQAEQFGWAMPTGQRAALSGLAASADRHAPLPASRPLMDHQVPRPR